MNETATGTLAGKVAVVTGAAKGIGRAIAATLAEHSAIVVWADVAPEAADQTVANSRKSSPTSIVRRVDITSRVQVTSLVDFVVGKFGKIDILVNNAGVTRQIDFFDLEPADVDWIVDVNVKGTFSMMQAVAVEMRRNGYGRIVNISSIAGKGYKNTSNVAYAASKGALIAMTRIAAAQLGKYGITVNTVCPGITESELMGAWLERRSFESGKPTDDLKRELLAESALQRVNSPLDIANAVLFLASDAARNITGQSLNVDGGIMWD